VCEYPETASLEDHLIKMKKEIESFQPTRVVLDSLSALERISSLKSFREFVIGITSFIKKKQITGIFTSTTPTLMGGTSITETNISTITDSIILLRYVEIYGEMKRGLAVLKMRGAMHDKSIREFTIDSSGIHIGKAFKNISGILSGNVVHAPQAEVDRIEEMFAE
jgi:circadian clock protein KaiC